MKRLIVCVVAMLAVSSVAMAQMDRPFVNLRETYYVINPNSGVSSFTVPEGTYEASVWIEGDAVRFWVQGTSPAKQTGKKITEGTAVALETPYEVTGFRFRSDITAASGGTVYVTFRGKR